jgi:hypothetical protein
MISQKAVSSVKIDGVVKSSAGKASKSLFPAKVGTFLLSR